MPSFSAYVAPIVVPAATTSDIVCSRFATTATFAAQVAAASAGETICLATGDYGTWTGTSKAITIAAQPGQNPVMTLNLGATAANFTIDGGHTEISASTNGMVRQSSFTSSGIKLRSIDTVNGVTNITIKRCWFGPDTFAGAYVSLGGTNMNFVIDRCRFYQLNGGEEAILCNASNQSITIKNCLFHDFDADGVRLAGSGTTIQDCEFLTVNPHGDGSLHTDCIQVFGDDNCTVQRCYFKDFEQAFGAFDGMSSCTIQDNAFDSTPYSSPAHWLSCYADNPGSTINHNTLYDGSIICTSKAGGAVSIGFYRNNICDSISLTDGPVTGAPSQNTNNMFPSGASSPNINGTPTYVGGSHPTTWQGFKLANGSAGQAAGNDGLDVGIRAA